MCVCDLRGEKRIIKNCGELFERFSPRLDIVTIHEDTRGFIRTNLNQQFVVWPCKYDPQAILLSVLDQALSYVQKQDRGTLPFECCRSRTSRVVDGDESSCSGHVHENTGDRRLYIHIDHHSTGICRSVRRTPAANGATCYLGKETVEKVTGVELSFSLCKMNVIPSHVLAGVLEMMKHTPSNDDCQALCGVSLIVCCRSIGYLPRFDSVSIVRG